MKRHLVIPTLAGALAFAVAPAMAQLISDDFEVDSSANYTIVDDSNGASGDGGADSTSQFAFDYIAAGIPLAPNSDPGDTGGLRLTVNASEEGDEGPSSTEEDHITAFNNLSVSGSYRLDVDIYMGVDLLQPGTTEFAHVGVAGGTSDFTSIFTPVVDNGHFMSMTGEGGSFSDYRHSVPGSPAVPNGDPSYLNSNNTVNASDPFYQDLFPAASGTDSVGSPTNIWTTRTITVGPEFVAYYLDGTKIIQTPVVEDSGLVSLGYTDPFDSVGPHFVIYDNLVVTMIPEPTTAVLGVSALVALVSRRRR